MVPPWLRQQPQLVLQVGLDMAIPIPDLKVDEHGVFGTLSFSRKPFTCSVPWHGVFAVVGDDGKGMVWPESMPPEVASEVEREARRAGFRTVPTPEMEGEQGRPFQPGEAVEAPQPAVAQPAREVDDEERIPQLSDLSGRSRGERASQPAGRGRGAASRRKPVKLPPYLRVVK